MLPQCIRNSLRPGLGHIFLHQPQHQGPTTTAKQKENVSLGNTCSIVMIDMAITVIHGLFDIAYSERKQSA